MKRTLPLFILLFFALAMNAQVGTNGMDRSEEGRPVKKYNLVIDERRMTLGGVTSEAMAINGSIPGPVLEFNEGDLAVINVTNRMKMETSVHWHGIIIPNFFDGVPYLTTPPIKPGTTFQYRIPINQTGTYWYHSHTMLQEQSGVYGSIVIHPKDEQADYDSELVMVLSDWTNEKPTAVLRNLKRGNEWYQVKKKTAVPLSRVIAEGGLGAQLKMWRDRMEGADIADVYYPTFLSNGKKLAEYPEFKTGEKVRLRFINASASTYFWMDFGAGTPTIISVDGLDVQPVQKNRFLFAIAETYDIIVTIPNGKLEIIATAQDGSGHTTIHLGSGMLHPAQVVDRPDKIEMMKEMAKMDMKMGAPAIVGNKKKNTPEKLMQTYGMKMDMDMEHGHADMDHTNHSQADMNMNHDDMEMNNGQADMHHHQETDDTQMHQQHTPAHHSMGLMAPNDTSVFDYKTRQTYFNYDFLSAKEETAFDPGLKVNELLLNLTGNMNRFVWSLNGVPLSEADKIKIKGGEVTRIVLNNLTMMHHPMHLHGHFFRVINKNGERSPLKHTVNVPPMEKVTIEFYNEEYGDWFFHCHMLYHMMSGMARTFSYDTPRDERLKDYPEENLIRETDMYFFWGSAQLGSNFSEAKLTLSNIRNEFGLRAEMDYSKNAEVEVNYNRYINDWVRLYAGINAENESPDAFDEFNVVGLAGIKYFTPYMFNVDLSLDHQLRPRFRIDRELLLLPRFFLEGEYQYRADFGLVNNLPDGLKFMNEAEWTVRGAYMLSLNFSLQANYNNHHGWGAGLTVRF